MIFIQNGQRKGEYVTIWSVPDRVVNFIHLIDKTNFEHRSLDNVIAFNSYYYKVTLHLGGLPKSSSKFSKSRNMFNIWLTI